MRFSIIGKIKNLLCRLGCCNSSCMNNNINIVLDEQIEEHINKKVEEIFKKKYPFDYNLIVSV